MRASLAVLALVQLAAASPGMAQERTTEGDTAWTPLERKFRTGVLNAIFAFRSDLRGDSTKIAACRVAGATQDSAKALAPEFHQLLIEPLVPQTNAPAWAQCGVVAFRRDGARVLWLESLVEVRRRGGTESIRARIGPAGNATFEAAFQLLIGTGVRVFERYEVKPNGNDGASWRVTKYEHGGTEFSHPNSRSFVPPRD
jgi:hypothetical protein